MLFDGAPLIAGNAIPDTIPAPAAHLRLAPPSDLNATVTLDSLTYRFDICLQGGRCLQGDWEMVFCDIPRAASGVLINSLLLSNK